MLLSLLKTNNDMVNKYTINFEIKQEDSYYSFFNSKCEGVQT